MHIPFVHCYFDFQERPKKAVGESKKSKKKAAKEAVKAAAAGAGGGAAAGGAAAVGGHVPDAPPNQVGPRLILDLNIILNLNPISDPVPDEPAGGDERDDAVDAVQPVPGLQGGPPRPRQARHRLRRVRERGGLLIHCVDTSRNVMEEINSLT